jgi:hypothetical protein
VEQNRSIGYGAAQWAEECKTDAKMWSRNDSIGYGVFQLLSALTNTLTLLCLVHRSGLKTAVQIAREFSFEVPLGGCIEVHLIFQVQNLNILALS